MVVEVASGTCDGFPKENGEGDKVDEAVVGTVEAPGESVDGVAAGIKVEGGEKPEVVAATVPLIESLVVGEVAKEIDVFGLLCGIPELFTSPSATAGAGVSVIVGIENGLVPSSGADALGGISAKC